MGQLGRRSCREIRSLITLKRFDLPKGSERFLYGRQSLDDADHVGEAQVLSHREFVAEHLKNDALVDLGDFAFGGAGDGLQKDGHRHCTDSLRIVNGEVKFERVARRYGFDEDL